MNKKLIIHVGYPKTGTTYLQSLIFPSSQRIEYLGTFYSTEGKKLPQNQQHPRANAY